jgi:FtsP/CotA-like multicopper oxidase with cupredoxin domain
LKWTIINKPISRRGYHYYAWGLVSQQFPSGVEGVAGSVSGYALLDLDVQAEHSPRQFDSTLINGKGRYIGGPSVPLAVVNVRQHLRSVLQFDIVPSEKLTCSNNNSYRLRIVSISCDPSFVFSIDGHQLTIIEVDGNNVQPLVVDSLEIFAGKQI